MLNNAANTSQPCVLLSSYQVTRTWTQPKTIQPKSVTISPGIVTQLVSNMVEEFASLRFDYVILDEGHTMKNPSTKLSKAMHALRSDNRLILTGTPVQVAENLHMNFFFTYEFGIYRLFSSDLHVKFSFF